MTQRLYYTDAYCARFDARVVEVVTGERPRVYLDRTAFYPTSGGQPHDHGTLGGIEVLDVIDDGERIAHVLARAPEEERVLGEIDWARRFDHMQQHSGQHLLSAICADSLGAQTLSVHFGSRSSTLDLALERLEEDTLAATERRANEIVWENRPISVSFEQADGATGLRKETQRQGELRVVSIAGLDRSACGGTHVRSTGEIGPVLLRRTERIKKALRLEFLCGSRAIARARADFTLLSRMAQQVSTSIEDLGHVFETQQAALQEAESARRRLSELLDQQRARDLYQAAEADALGVRRVLQRASSLEEVRGVALAFAAMPRALFVAACETPAALLLAASDDSGVNAGELLRSAVTAVGGRGGGSPRLAQGSVPSREALEAALGAIIG